MKNSTLDIFIGTAIALCGVAIGTDAYKSAKLENKTITGENSTERSLEFGAVTFLACIGAGQIGVGLAKKTMKYD